MNKIFGENKIVAILRNIPLEKIIDIVNIAYSEGIKAFEVSLVSKDSIKQIEKIKKYFDTKIIIGAGTVTNVDLVKASLDVGVDFIFSPSSDEKVLDFCRANSINLIPGVFSPSDVSLCSSYGYNLLKLFPANIFPLTYIRDLKGPFPNTEYIAVGGVNEKNYKDFLNAGYIGVGIGSNLFPKELILNNDWESIRKIIAKYK